MENSEIFFFLLKRFFDYYRLPLSVINSDGETLYCFPQEAAGYILPPSVMRYELDRYHNSQIEYYTPFLINAPYDSFIAIIPLPNEDYLFVGPAFTRSFSVSRIKNYSNKELTKQEMKQLQEITKKLPLIDEAYLTDALSLLVLLLHYKEIRPEDILSANNLTHHHKTLFHVSNVIGTEYDELLLFETQVQSFVQNGKDKALSRLWESFSTSVKEKYREYMYAEHHLMIPLLSSARQAALIGGAPKEDVLSIFHSTILQISSKGSVSVNLKIVERATLDLCDLVKKNRSTPFRTDLCIKCEQYIDEHLGEKITASDIAESCGVDRSLVFDIFRKNYNISLTEYIQREKMRRAKILLLHTTAPISEIASSLGYCSNSYFSKVFFSHFKCTPTKCRAKKRTALSQKMD